jgi:hypothetical protein
VTFEKQAILAKMVCSHTKAEEKALPPPLSLLGCSSAAHAINWHKFLTVRGGTGWRLLPLCQCTYSKEKSNL